MPSETELVELQQTLYKSRNPTRHWLHSARRDWIIDALKRYASDRRGKALEVGPGSGIYLPILASLYQEVTAIDVEAAYLKRVQALAGTYPNITTVADDITNSKLSDEGFDLILCSEVVEHIANSATGIKEMHRLLKPGGTLILSTPQRYSTLELMVKIAFIPGIINLIRLIYRESILEPGHINLMADKQVTRQLEEAGFCIRERFKSGMYLPLIAEFMGQLGLSLEQWLESKLRDTSLDRLLWTQYYIAEA